MPLKLSHPLLFISVKDSLSTAKSWRLKSNSDFFSSPLHPFILPLNSKWPQIFSFLHSFATVQVMTFNIFDPNYCSCLSLSCFPSYSLADIKFSFILSPPWLIWNSNLKSFSTSAEPAKVQDPWGGLKSTLWVGICLLLSLLSNHSSPHISSIVPGTQWAVSCLWASVHAVPFCLGTNICRFFS